MRVVVAVLLLFSAAPAAAAAGEVIPTAPAEAPRPAAAPVSALPEVGEDGAAAGRGEQRWGPCGPEAVAADGTAETKAHGYVEGGVGTGGYRHVGAGFCKPLENGGAVAVSVSQTQFDDRRLQGR